MKTIDELELIRGVNGDVSAAVGLYSHVQISEATNLLIRYHLIGFQDHFSDPNLTDILEENFTRLLGGNDWASCLFDCRDERLLGELMSSYYALIECSIWKENEGEGGKIFIKAKNHTSQVLKFLAQDIASYLKKDLRSEKNGGVEHGYEGEVSS